jgi:hypothetical protein
MKFLPISFKIQLLETSPQKQKEQIRKQQDGFFLMSFPFQYILYSLQSFLLLTFCPVCLLVKESAEIETGTAEKSSWDQANIREKQGLFWRNRKKISQIIKDYFYLPFFLLIILCWQQMSSMLSLELQPRKKNNFRNSNKQISG